MKRRFVRRLGCGIFGGIAGAIALVGCIYGGLLLRRPSKMPSERQLFAGVVYRRWPRSQPRPLMLHVVEIDLTTPGIEAFVTPGSSGDDRAEFDASTTTDFLRTHQLQLAINGSFFSPFYSRHPLDFYPRTRDRVDALGHTISNGKEYSPPEPHRGVLCFVNRRATIREERCPPGTSQGLAGGRILVQDGEKTRSIPKRLSVELDLFPRTVVASDRSGNRLWLIVVDGRQPFYSEGIAIAELAEILVSLGIDTALNLDGGGSTTLAIAHNGKARLLNAPIHTRIPMRERPVANHLGIFAPPQP